MISPNLPYFAASAVIFVLSLHALLTQPHLVRKVVSLNAMGAAVFLVLIAAARRGAGAEPDPVPHAMVLTGIVVAVSASAFALALARRIHRETGATSLEDEGEPG